MEDKNYEGVISPAQVHENMTNASINKANMPLKKLIILGFMAGLCIALGAEASSCAMHSIKSVGVARMAAGIVFPVGLIALVLAGGELFTGNCMMLMGVAGKRIKIIGLLRNWIIVYITNLLGGVFIAYIVSQTGQWNYTDGLLGAMTIKIALGKVTLSPMTAICSGIMCNIFVCLAVLMASSSKSLAGKILAIIVPISAFVISGFEHCVANMYYIPAGIMASKNSDYAAKASEAYGITANQLEKLNIGSFFYDNLLFVTIGNIIGGGIVIGLLYYFAFIQGTEKKNTDKKTKDK
ncbi:MAG: formate/nitrite transporter family protein [Lachnospiraceae bacterium]|nr:formate/nitrite transporter family protein [Lachnospiraceae bacterium]